jgi:hypothetical protein
VKEIGSVFGSFGKGIASLVAGAASAVKRGVVESITYTIEN